MLALSENFITADDDLETTLPGSRTQRSISLTASATQTSCSSWTASFYPLHRQTPSWLISMLCKCSSRKGVPAGSGR